MIGVAVANRFKGVPSGLALHYWQMYYIVNVTHHVQFAFQMTWFLRMWRLHGFSSWGSVLFTSVFTLAFSARLPLTCVNICHCFLVDITCQEMRSCLSKRFPLGLILLHMVSTTETRQCFTPCNTEEIHTPWKVFANYFAKFSEIFFVWYLCAYQKWSHVPYHCLLHVVKLSWVRHWRTVLMGLQRCSAFVESQTVSRIFHEVIICIFFIASI